MITLKFNASYMFSLKTNFGFNKNEIILFRFFMFLRVTDSACGIRETSSQP